MAGNVDMLNRFIGDAGRSKLVEAIQQQKIVAGDKALAERLAAVGRPIQFDDGDVICRQGDGDDDVFLILNGRVNVFVNHQHVDTRVEGEAVGEMAMVDPAAQRSATLKAVDTVLALKVSAEDFKAAGQNSGLFWRPIAQQIAVRLRERARFHLPANEVPIMFVGSSVEGLKVAQEVQAGLQHERVIVRLWTNHVFGPSKYPIEDLLHQVEAADFALFVFGPDDKIQSRDETHAVPRDNVLFEMGLFMGRLGRDRVFIVKAQDVDLKIPSDLTGINPIAYKCKPGCDISDVIGPACIELRRVIGTKGALTNRMRICP